MLTFDVKPQALLMDFDGVLTDNYVYTSSDGTETVRCSKADSLGLSLIRSLPIYICVISSETNRVVEQRCSKLQVPFYSGVTDKGSLILEITSELGIPLENTIYIGNDVNDFPALDVVGCPICVADSHYLLFSKNYNRTKSLGGHGAVREVCDAIIQCYST